MPGPTGVLPGLMTATSRENRLFVPCLIKSSDKGLFSTRPGGVLRWVRSPEIAAALYGTDWKKKVHDISDAFFGSYTFGTDITSAGS